MLRDRVLAGYVAARGISQVGSEMTFLGLPWFVLCAAGLTLSGLAFAAVALHHSAGGGLADAA